MQPWVNGKKNFSSTNQGVATLGETVLVAERDKVRLVTNIKPLGRACRALLGVIEAFQIDKQARDSPLLFDDAMVRCDGAAQFLQEQREANSSRLRRVAGNAVQGPDGGFSATVHETADVARWTPRRVLSSVEAAGCRGLRSCPTYMQCFKLQDATESHFGQLSQMTTSGTGGVPTALEINTSAQQATREKQNGCGFLYFRGKGGDYYEVPSSSAVAVPAGVEKVAAPQRHPSSTATEARQRRHNASTLCRIYPRVRIAATRAKLKELPSTTPYEAGWREEIQEKSEPPPATKPRAAAVGGGKRRAVAGSGGGGGSSISAGDGFSSVSGWRVEEKGAALISSGVATSCCALLKATTRATTGVKKARARAVVKQHWALASFCASVARPQAELAFESGGAVLLYMGTDAESITSQEPF
jgi:hypothetical protein